MTTTVYERSPQIELFNGRLSPEQIRLITARNPSPVDTDETWKQALMEWRAYAIMKGRAELAAMVPEDITATTIRTVMNTLWQLFFPHWTRATGPMIAEAYIQGFNMVRRDEVPIQMIYRLADDHARRVGEYFNETSTEAMVLGFEKFVNKQVPRKVALERVLQSYGLAPRQVSGYVAAEQLWQGKTNSAVPINMKAKIQQYISKSLSQRLGVFARQEQHNLDMQAQQVAWMWLVENNKLPEQTKKMWLTAKDEKVCKVCGPMNAKKVSVLEKFELPDGNELFVPGAHVNCRCEVKLWVNPFQPVEKAWDPKEHPRGGDPENKGRFSRKAPDPQVAEQERSQVLEDMLRQVREMQAQEQVIEAAPPEPEAPSAVFRSTTPTPSAVFRERPSAVFNLPEPEPEPPSATFRVPEPTKTEAPSAIFKPAGGFWQQPEASFDLERILLEQAKRQTAEQEEGIYTVEEMTTYRPTRPLLGKGDEPGRGIVILADGDQLTPDQDQVKLVDRVDRVHMVAEPYRNEYIKRKIQQQYDINMLQMLDGLVGEGQESKTIYEMHDGHQIYSEVPREKVEEMLKANLRRPDDPALHDERWDSEPAFEPDWHYVETGQPVESLENEQIAFSELSDYFDFNSTEYEVVMVNIDEGYDDASRLEEEEWNAPGTYIAANAQKKFIEGRDGELIPYRVVDARPDVREHRESVYRDPTEEIRRRWRRQFPDQEWPHG